MAWEITVDDQPIVYESATIRDALGVEDSTLQVSADDQLRVGTVVKFNDTDYTVESVKLDNETSKWLHFARSQIDGGIVVNNLLEPLNQLFSNGLAANLYTLMQADSQLKVRAIMGLDPGGRVVTDEEYAELLSQRISAEIAERTNIGTLQTVLRRQGFELFERDGLVSVLPSYGYRGEYEAEASEIHKAFNVSLLIDDELTDEEQLDYITSRIAVPFTVDGEEQLISPGDTPIGQRHLLAGQYNNIVDGTDAMVVEVYKRWINSMTCTLTVDGNLELKSRMKFITPESLGLPNNEWVIQSVTHRAFSTIEGSRNNLTDIDLIRVVPDELEPVTKTVDIQTPGLVQRLRTTHVFSGTVVVEWRPPADGGEVEFYDFELLDGAGAFIRNFSRSRYPTKNVGEYVRGHDEHQEVISTLNQDTEYRLSIRAVNGIGRGPVSTISFRTNNTLPISPDTIAVARLDHLSQFLESNVEGTRELTLFSYGTTRLSEANVPEVILKPFAEVVEFIQPGDLELGPGSAGSEALAIVTRESVSQALTLKSTYFAARHGIYVSSGAQFKIVNLLSKTLQVNQKKFLLGQITRSKLTFSENIRLAIFNKLRSIPTFTSFQTRQLSGVIARTTLGKLAVKGLSKFLGPVGWIYTLVTLPSTLRDLGTLTFAATNASQRTFVVNVGYSSDGFGQNIGVELYIRFRDNLNRSWSSWVLFSESEYLSADVKNITREVAGQVKVQSISDSVPGVNGEDITDPPVGSRSFYVLLPEFGSRRVTFQVASRTSIFYRGRSLRSGGSGSPNAPEDYVPTGAPGVEPVFSRNGWLYSGEIIPPPIS